jgi:hypothetical protein
LDHTPDLKTACAAFTAASTFVADAAWQCANISPVAGSSTASLVGYQQGVSFVVEGLLTDCSASPATSFPSIHIMYFLLEASLILLWIMRGEGKKIRRKRRWPSLWGHDKLAAWRSNLRFRKLTSTSFANTTRRSLSTWVHYMGDRVYLDSC